LLAFIIESRNQLKIKKLFSQTDLTGNDQPHDVAGAATDHGEIGIA